MFVDHLPEPPSKSCSRCLESKPVEEFSWHRRAKGQRNSVCRSCQAAYGRAHYAAHRRRYIENATKRKQAVTRERLAYLLRFFAEHPCIDCGERDPRVLEFDHRGDKAFNISHGFRDRPWVEVLTEIAKCDVRCANCHRKRTAEQFGFYRALLYGEQNAHVGADRR